jgi:hypothetical protein
MWFTKLGDLISHGGGGMGTRKERKERRMDALCLLIATSWAAKHKLMSGSSIELIDNDLVPCA